MEEWRDVPGYKGFYQVSSYGRLKSLERIVKNYRSENCRLKSKFIKGCVNNKGYVKVRLSKEGKYRTYALHQVVAMAFLDHIPNYRLDKVVDHIDENKQNNRLDNLQIISNSENVKRSMKPNHGTWIDRCHITGRFMRLQ